MTHPSSLREHLANLAEAGELATVGRQVDWNLEMGAIARRCYETGAPAPLFTDVKDCRAGFRALGALMGASRRPGQRLARVALALGLPASATAGEIVETLAAARTRAPIAPALVDDAPFRQHVRRGRDVDLTTLPVPYLHCGDGGRYLNSLGVIVVRTPDRRWTSWSVARVMLLDERRATGTFAPFQHIGRVHNAWRRHGEDMPFAIALGVPPAVLYAAGMPLPEEMDEADYVGALLGAPAEVARCASVALEVPAQSEIVIEGRVSITELGLEGPFGEYAGYVHPHYSVPQPVYTVEAISFRDQAIFPFSCSGEPPEENHTIWGVATAAEAVHRLREAGLPVTAGWLPFEASNGWLVVTVPGGWREAEPDAEQFCRRIGDVVYTSKVGDPVNTIVVLEDDVDPSDLRELVWAIDGRRNGTLAFAGKRGFAMSPYTKPDEFDYPKGWTSTAEVWNCLPPEGRSRPPRTRFADNYPAELQARVLAHWDEDGLGADEPAAARA